MGLVTENFSLLLSESGLLKSNNVSIKSNDSMHIRSKRIAIVSDDMDPMLKGAVPGPSLEHRAKLSRAVIARSREGAFIFHIGIRVSRDKIIITWSSTSLICMNRVGNSRNNILKDSSKLLQLSVSCSKFFGKLIIGISALISVIITKVNSGIGDPRSLAPLIRKERSSFRGVNRNNRRRDTEGPRGLRSRSRRLSRSQRSGFTILSFAFTFPFWFNRRIKGLSLEVLKSNRSFRLSRSDLSSGINAYAKSSKLSEAKGGVGRGRDSSSNKPPGSTKLKPSGGGFNSNIPFDVSTEPSHF